MATIIKELGPCVVIWDGRGIDPGTPVEFNKSMGGVTFRYEELRAPIVRDQAGLTQVSEVTTGVTNPELEVPLSEIDVKKLDFVFMNSTAVPVTSLKVRNPVGVDLFARARQVIAKPIFNGVVSLVQTEWLYLHRAIPRVAMEITYDNAGQRVHTVFFKGFPDDQSGRIHEMWRYGTD